jgi:hypothetical protein
MRYIVSRTEKMCNIHKAQRYLDAKSDIGLSDLVVKADAVLGPFFVVFQNA